MNRNGIVCSEIEPQLEALLFGELHGREGERVERHLAGCAACSDALADARLALAALGDVKAPPLPYADTPKVMRWLDLQASRSSTRWVGLAAALLVGILLGRFLPREAIAPPETTAVSIEPEALAALERAELLSDVGVRYVSGLRDMLSELAGFTMLDVSAEDAARTRERARSLIRDGVLLTRTLERDRDASFLRAIRRAGPFLEELAALETSTNPASLRMLQASLQNSELPRAVSRLALEDDIARALASSGFLAGDYANDNAGASRRKDF